MLNRNLESILVAGLFASAICTSAHAGVITAASAVVSAPTPIGSFTWETTIDQSGLTTGYVSGVTDFDTYVASLPRHVGSNTPPNYAAAFVTFPENVDYDLGSTGSLLKLAFWNYPHNNGGAVTSIEVFTSNDASFAASSTLVGTFAPLVDSVSIGPPGNLVQVFDLIDTNARYLRINVLAAQQNVGMGWSEVAFDVGTFAAAPEPATYALMLAGLGLLGFVARRQKKLQKATAA